MTGHPDKGAISAALEWPPLIPGVLVKRYKRFLADVRLDSGEIVTAHCANSGKMTECCESGQPVYLSYHDNPKRKLKYTWEMIRMPNSLVGVNTLVPNRLVGRSIEAGAVPELSGYDRVQPEVKAGPHTRLDFKLTGNRRKPCYVEVKNCTLVQNGVAAFPDAVTTRGQKHLMELERLVEEGCRSVIFFLVQRTDARSFRPADEIDPAYGEALRSVLKNGVEALVYDVAITLNAIRLNKKILFEIS